MATKEKSPQNVTVYGRLSFPNFTMAQALARNSTSQYKVTDDKVKPDFNLLLEQAQFDKFVTHANDVFLPWTIQREADGEKKNALTAAEVKKIQKVFKDLTDQPPYIPLKPVNEKTAASAPEAVASLKVVGNVGSDMELRAIVEDETQLVVPDPDRVDWPAVYPIGNTVHQMYPGCYVVCTLNLYAFKSGNLPGFSASASVPIFKADGERFGGGMSVDEDEIFMD